ncbi:hypothetical protein [Actinokineospora pegani]|uniref:hypothetical protein n=1 Tax=Actinokineospora pegani TaxID=2654637 RepID=UPI0012EAC5CF|nr:hypothetical protein [Actinokineospora pegani]
MKRVQKLAVVMGAAVALATGVPGVAAATTTGPTWNCTAWAEYGVNGGRGESRCSGIDGVQRVYLVCLENNGHEYVAFGGWVYAGQWSYAVCHEFAAPVAVAASY